MFFFGSSFEDGLVLPLTREWIEMEIIARVRTKEANVLPLTREWIEILS